MNYREAENYILSFSNIPKKEYLLNSNTCEIYLERLKYFLSLIGSPEKKIPHYIHITGTSGKGSLASFLSSILTEDKKKTGTITSPHPFSINERWAINGRKMARNEFVEIVKKIKPAIDRYISESPFEMLSFFELTEAIGFYFLAKNNVKWAVLEAGCGGRYDSSNVIPHKDIAVVTNIGFDHTDILGDTKEKITFEKAGIINKKTKVFTSENDKGCLAVIKKECQKTNSSLYKLNENEFKIIKTDISGTDFEYNNKKYRIKLLGNHQVKNATLAIKISNELGIKNSSIERGLKKTTHPLAMEIIKKSPLVILDSAHNEDKIKSSVEAIKQVLKDRKIDLVVGFSDNKNFVKMISYLSSLNLANIAISRNTINHFRKVVEPQKIRKEFEKKGKKAKIKIFSDPLDAFFWVINKDKKNIKFVTGSAFLSGEIRGKYK